jgi:hypothetical protein
MTPAVVDNAPVSTFVELISEHLVRKEEDNINNWSSMLFEAIKKRDEQILQLTAENLALRDAIIHKDIVITGLMIINEKITKKTS